MADNKEDVKEAVDNIQVSVEDVNSGQKVHFKIKKNTNFRKLMKAYCDRLRLDIQLVRFTHDGRRVHADHSPQDLDIEDGDILEVFQEQQGGLA